MAHISDYGIVDQGRSGSEVVGGLLGDLRRLLSRRRATPAERIRAFTVFRSPEEAREYLADIV